jgi:transmembrane sensor
MILSRDMSTESTQAIEEAASTWLIRRDSGAWTPADESRFQEWLEASSLHRVAFWRLETAWEESGRLKALGAGFSSDRPPPPGEWTLTPFFEARDEKGAADQVLAGGVGIAVTPDTLEGPKNLASIARQLTGVELLAPQEPPSRTQRGTRLAAFGMAASLLLALALGSYHYWLSATADRYTTPVGGIASVPLQDGSNITLNTATEVHVTLSAEEREIDLARGEAFFEVAKDSKRPFVVKAGKKRVIAVGTQFSVLRDGDEIRVIVSEGTVRIEDRGTQSPPVLPLTSGNTAAVLLSAGSIAHAGDSGVLVQRESLSETQVQLSWRTGILMFRDQTLAEAAAEFNRYNERKIVIRDPAVADLKIEGNFRATNVDAFIRLLESGFPVHASESDAQIVLSSN